MDITFAPRGILQIDNAIIIHKNFSGEGSKFNREGDRSFSLRIEDPDTVEALKKEGWNVKTVPPREEGDEPFSYMKVKVKFSSFGPNIYLKSGRALTKLDEETCGCIDNMEILGVDLDIRPYDWTVNGKTGRTAYLQSIRVVQKVDRFAE